MENILKTRLMCYAIISAFTFTYLILPESASISVPLFIIIQFISVYFLLNKTAEIGSRNALWFFAPMFILSLNSFTSGSNIWHFSNFIVVIVLFGSMVTLMTGSFPSKEFFPKFISSVLTNVTRPITYFPLPFKWSAEYNKEKTVIIKRCILGILVALPCVAFLIIMLSSADMVFSNNMSNFFERVFDLVNVNLVFKIIWGGIAGLYLFGMIYIVFSCKKEETPMKTRKVNGDLIIINIMLFSILIVYTIFVSIQFKYLFAGTTLPYGLSYSQYARRGFFELFSLSVLNISLILLVTYLLEEKIYKVKSLWALITKVFMLYLASITLVLLVSSFYRMWLYDHEFGYTHLRVLVFGFLIFEAIGLIMTFIYILKPTLNIMAVYIALGLCYYLLLNSVNIDNIIAKRNIDRYLAGEKTDIAYLMRLSTDAAPQIARLMTDEVTDISVKNKAEMYFMNIDEYYGNLSPGWQRYNLSVSNARKIWAEYSDKE